MSKSINVFAVLDDSDDDEAPVIVTQSKKNGKSKSSSSSAKGAPAKSYSNSNSNSNSNNDNSNSSYSNSNNDNSNVKPNSSGRPRRTNNDRNTKLGRGPRQAREGKRTYDRRSGTGRGKEINKGGGGSRNWGSEKNDAKRAEGDVLDNLTVDNDAEDVTAAATNGDEPNTATENGTDATPNEPEPILEQDEEESEPEPENTQTVDEYYASLKKVTLFESKHGQKKLDNEFEGKNAHVVTVEEDFLVMGSGKALRKKKKNKNVEKLDISFRFKKGDAVSSDGGRDGRDGGGRGGNRDGGGRGGNRDGGGRGGNRDGGRGGGDRRNNDKRRGDRRGGGQNSGRGRRGGGGRGSSFALDSNAFPSL